MRRRFTASTPATPAGTSSARTRLQWDKPEEAAASLQNGLESRIVFTVQLFEKGQGVYPFNADRLLAQKTVGAARSGISSTPCSSWKRRGAPDDLPGTAELMETFFSLRGIFLYDFPGRRHTALYVAARAQYEPVRLMPPLTLVNLVGPPPTSPRRG